MLHPWMRVETLGDHVGQAVTLNGWLYNKRTSGKVHFLLLRDGTGIVQTVMSQADVPAEVFNLYHDLTQESSIEITGLVKADKRAPGGYEINLTNLKIIKLAEEYPITPKEHGSDFLLKRRHLWLRSRRQQAVMRIRAELIRVIQEYFDQQGFIRLDAPIFSPSNCEGASTLFTVPYFGHSEAYLTQSGQLYAEAGAMALGRVYTFGPTFRAEKSKTRRHLTEFWMVEPELAFADLDDIMDLAEDLISFLMDRILQKRSAELETLERDTQALQKVTPPFIRLTYDEALEELKRLGSGLEWGQDLGGTDETLLSSRFDRPLLIHRYPVQTKAFYMKSDPSDPRLSLCVDMLAPEGYGEIIGGSQREDDLDALVNRMEKEGIPREPLEWYLDLRRYGSVPHSGFGLGLERTVAWLCGLKHVREAIPFPRLMDRFYP
ncbi:MAG: asparagine--tRNA ligase [Deltaproteobacteria bacterium]|nr:asparagine--tRNA ligase [Deltaproteobacteria bacterium]MBW2085254.1 asparagine--tRNA ligase [Deltaproteobacteria bacterium]